MIISRQPVTFFISMKLQSRKNYNKKPRGFMQSCWNETETFYLFLIYLYLFLSDYYSERYYNLLYNNYIYVVIYNLLCNKNIDNYLELIL